MPAEIDFLCNWIIIQLILLPSDLRENTCLESIYLSVDTMKKVVKKLMPRPMQLVLKKAYNFMADNYELMSGERDSLTPPRRLIFVGQGDFKKTGQGFLEYFISIGLLVPFHISYSLIPLTTISWIKSFVF